MLISKSAHRLRLALVSLVLVLLLPACETRCGAGTERVGSECVVARSDAGMPSEDGGNEDAAALLGEFTDIQIRVLYPYAARNGTDPVIPVGGIVDITARGLTLSREWVTLPASVMSVEGPAVGRRREGTSDRRHYLSVVGSAPGRARVIASVETMRGVREAEIFVEVESPATPPALRCITVQDRPGIFDLGDFSSGLDAIELPSDLAARVLCTLSWTAATGTATLTSFLSPEDYNAVWVSGPGRIEERTRVIGTGVGDVTLSVAYAPLGTAVSIPMASAQVRFIADSPTIGISFQYEYSTSRVSTLRAGSEPAIPDAFSTSSTTAVRHLEPHAAEPLTLVAWHASPSGHYFRPVAMADANIRWAPGTNVASIDADGMLRWLAPGVDGVFLTAEGFVAPLLVASRYPATTSVSIRTMPASVALTVNEGGGAPVCTTLQVLVRIDGTERTMTPIEMRALARNFVAGPFAHSLSRPGQDLTQFCISPAEHFAGEPSVSTGESTLSWIQSEPNDFTTAIRIPYTITWL